MHSCDDDQAGAAFNSSTNIARRLVYLGYPNAAEFDIDSAGDCAALVYWLEDTKIRALEPEDRSGMFEFGPETSQADRFSNYLAQLGYSDSSPSSSSSSSCPSPSSSLSREQLSWLIEEAVALDFADNSEDTFDLSTAIIQQAQFERQLADDPERKQLFQAGLLKIAEALGFASGNFIDASPLNLIRTLQYVTTLKPQSHKSSPILFTPLATELTLSTLLCFAVA